MKIIKVTTLIVFMVSAAFYMVGKHSMTQSDTTPPVITSDIDCLEIEAGSDEKQLLQGLTAVDDRDGDLTSEILIGTISNFTDNGNCRVQYLVFDENNNVGTYEREVHFISYVSPRYVLTAPLVYHESGDVILSDRLYAKDVLEGDITDKIRYTYSNIDRSKSGTYQMTVEVKNQYGDVTQETLPVNIVPKDMDTTQIQLTTYLTYTEQGSKIDPETYIQKVVDSAGEEISKENIVITSSVNTKKAENGQIKYELYEDGEVVSTTYLTVIVTDERG